MLAHLRMCKHRKEGNAGRQGRSRSPSCAGSHLLIFPWHRRRSPHATLQGTWRTAPPRESCFLGLGRLAQPRAHSLPLSSPGRSPSHHKHWYFTVFVKYICIFIALFIFSTQQLKSLLLKSLVDVWLCLFFASFLSDLPHAFWRCIIVCLLRIVVCLWK